MPEVAAKLLPIPLLYLVRIHGIVLVILALCFLLRFYLKYVGIIALLVMFSIIGGVILLNGFDEIVVRDIGIFGLILSVWLYEIKEKTKK